MNWPRIRLGTLLAASVIFFWDVVTGLVARHFFGAVDTGVAAYLKALATAQLLPDLIAGFLVCWLYVLARPRLGPGPRTAAVIGSIAFSLAFLQLFSPLVWMQSPREAALGIAVHCLKFIAAAYVAGWQYIEKAPD